ncbi:hypothetical protein U1Q18_013833 [Sarracenia purpurea var. burkii]
MNGMISVLDCDSPDLSFFCSASPLPRHSLVTLYWDSTDKLAVVLPVSWLWRGYIDHLPPSDVVGLGFLHESLHHPFLFCLN